MPQFDDDVYLGPAISGGPAPFGSSPGASRMDRGVGPVGRTYVFDLGNPAALSATAVCAAQAIAGAGNAILNGALANGAQTLVTLAEGRALSMISTNAGDTTQTVTVTGTDVYGQTVTQTKTLNGTTIVNFTKAVKTVTRVAVSAAMAGNLTVGNRDAFGLPVVVTDAGYIISVRWAGALADDAGTLTIADLTSPATALTGDVRGTYVPSTAANGARRLVAVIALTGIQVGVNATRIGAFGVTQA